MTLLLLLQLAAAFLPALPAPPPPPAIFQAVQDDQERDGPDPAPLPGHGAYEHARGWICTKVETNERAKNVQCFCTQACMNGGSEDRSCLTSCANPKKCHCHDDDACAPDIQPPAPKPKPKPRPRRR